MHISKLQVIDHSPMNQQLRPFTQRCFTTCIVSAKYGYISLKSTAMKRLLFTWLLLTVNICLAQTTSIPDANFEQKLIDLGLDDILDGTVLNSNVNSVNSLNVSYANITDLTGIEAFTDLDSLKCYFNQLSSLDLSQNTQLSYLFCEHNNLTTLDLSQNTALSILYCQNNSLNSINVSQNTALIRLYCFNNQLTNLDLTNNSALQQLSVYNNQLSYLNLTNNTALTDFGCMNNPLQCLNLKNGNNLNMTSFSAIDNPNLSCIQVDDDVWSSANWSAYVDNGASFSTNCPNDCTLGLTENSKSNGELLKVVDLMGKEVDTETKGLLIYVYDDGSTKKIYIIE